MKEALEALKSEREQKYDLKKKLDEKLNNESFMKMSNFGLRLSGLTKFGSKLHTPAYIRFNLTN